MPNEHHHIPRNGRRDVRNEPRNEPSDVRGAEQRRLHPEQGQRAARDAGGRSESFSRQRDAEQLRAGYSPREWDRQDWSHNTRSEPDWDPERGFARGGDRWEEERYDGGSRYDRNESRPAGRGYESRGPQGGYQRDFEPGRYYDEREGARHLADWGPELREGRGEHSRLGQQLSDAGRRLIGKVKRIVRNPKNYRRSDERIREDVCDRLSVSDEVDPSDIEVTVSNGEVTLTGSVQTRQMKFMAEETADEVPGVHDVHNQLRVARGT